MYNAHCSHYFVKVLGELAKCSPSHPQYCPRRLLGIPAALVAFFVAKPDSCIFILATSIDSISSEFSFVSIVTVINSILVQ